ncbi:hypothetical protein HH310_27155 [Actinoplanes sp. TBRC 11911]|uniref:TerB N-terminal domain-containing protein n=1 Tax=Actinoplanes sp. TBRC 11911 TaxID=2729386 RepID=UPI00145EE352|nr:TerB N-terminal domain-containing protein [Actinoplanes sp. TBRC 11911]NMO54849.1 hypothetical protein [Actinoplanes sp. TBRC 11911]
MVTTLQSASGRWVPFGEPLTVGGHVIPGGMIYVGQRLPAATSPAEPSLIDPDLPVASASGRYTVPGSGPELAYRHLSPAARKAYLEWLAGGRRKDVPPGLVLLFCFGVERRILLDGDSDPTVQRELPALRAEVRGLRHGHGEGKSTLRDALDRLLDLLDLLTAGRDAPANTPDRETPTAVRVGLARFAISSAPVPTAWARTWIRHHPSFTPRRTESDCPAEFERLFTLRYRERHGSGITVASGGSGIRLRYHPSNPGLATTLVWRADLPDLLSEPSRVRPLVALRDEVAAALDPYRRWLARFPQGRDSLAAVPLLPAELVDVRYGKLGALRVWAERRLDGRPRTLIDASELREFWSAADPERMAAEEAAALLDVLARLGLGVEPDVRFGAPPLARGPAVLFRLGGPAADRPGPHFASAVAIARCAAAVAFAAAPESPPGATLLATVAGLAAALDLDPGEDLRLAARLSWLLTTRVEVDRLGRQTSVMTLAEREIAGHYLVTVAVTADPTIGPATVAAATRVYGILGLAVDLVFQRLHDRSTGGRAILPRLGRAGDPPAQARRRVPETAVEGPDEPVVIQAADGQPNGFGLPWAMSADTSSPGIQLDGSLIRQKVAESGTAAALLGAIFDTEEEHQEPAPLVPGLDRAHTALLQALGERPTLAREEFEALAAAHGVLPDGALDLLNEVALDNVGAPVVEGDTTLTVVNDVLLELLA